jgi:hypothetical protein
VCLAGTIFKRFDPAKLFVLVCQDVTERFHLLLSLLFVLVEEMDNSGRLQPNAELLRRCWYIFGAEILIDVTKHAVLAKLNDIRPTVYPRFMRVRPGLHDALGLEKVHACVQLALHGIPLCKVQGCWCLSGAQSTIDMTKHSMLAMLDDSRYPSLVGVSLTGMKIRAHRMLAFRIQSFGCGSKIDLKLT